MATYVQANTEQSKPEIRTWVVDFTDDLLTGVTISSGTAIHTPPSGTAGTPTVVVSSPYMNVTLGPLTTLGIHYLEARATLSDGEISTVTISIPVVEVSAAREGMLDMINEVRGMTDTGPNDFKIGGTSFWSDLQIQRALDKTRRNLHQVTLERWPSLESDGTYSYTEYHAPFGNLESGTAVFVVQDYLGGTAPAYTADYDSGIITFAADTGGTDYILTARTYDLNAAASDIWRVKAANASKYFDFQTDNHRVSKSQIAKQFMDMAKYYASLSETQSFSVTTIVRSDVNADWGEDWDS